MEAEFWLNKWQQQDIGFHLGEVNPMLKKHVDALYLGTQNRIFLPLCGKTNDIPWLLNKGYRVVGIELIETAVDQLFSALGLKPRILSTGPLKLYQAGDVEVFVGDIFTLQEAQLGPVDAVYDRAALVALPNNMRKRYTQHLTTITAGKPQLLITYAYDQQLRSGPPFSVDQQEVNQHYAANYHLSLLENSQVAVGNQKGVAAHELVWLLEPK